MENDEKDKQLYKEFLSGDNQAFDELVLKHKNNIIYFVSRYISNYEVAEDISQDVFVYILLNKHKYNFKYSLKTYLYIIAKSKALNYLKRERRLAPLVEEIYSTDRELEEKVFNKEKLRKIKSAMNKLKQEYQIAIYLADFEKVPYKEISKIMKKSESFVKNLIHRSRAKLRKILEEEGITYEN